MNRNPLTPEEDNWNLAGELVSAGCALPALALVAMAVYFGFFALVATLGPVAEAGDLDPAAMAVGALYFVSLAGAFLAVPLILRFFVARPRGG